MTHRIDLGDPHAGRYQGMTFPCCLAVILYLCSFAAVFAADQIPLSISLKSDKSAYLVGEKIEFTVSIKNASNEAVPVLLRGPHGNQPLGSLELVSDPASKVKTGFDVCDLGCGTFLQNGSIDANTEITAKYLIGPNTTWGPKGEYKFIFRVAKPRGKDKSSIQFQADSNVATVRLVGRE